MGPAQIPPPREPPTLRGQGYVSQGFLSKKGEKEKGVALRWEREKDCVRRNFLRVVIVASSPALGSRWTRRMVLLGFPGSVPCGSADGHPLALQPLAGYCPQFTDETGEAQKF